MQTVEISEADFQKKVSYTVGQMGEPSEVGGGSCYVRDYSAYRNQNLATGVYLHTVLQHSALDLANSCFSPPSS